MAQRLENKCSPTNSLGYHLGAGSTQTTSFQTDLDCPKRSRCMHASGRYFLLSAVAFCRSPASRYLPVPLLICGCSLLRLSHPTPPMLITKTPQTMQRFRSETTEKPNILAYLSAERNASSSLLRSMDASTLKAHTVWIQFGSSQTSYWEAIHRMQAIEQSSIG